MTNPTYTEADRTDGIEPDMADSRAAPKVASTAPAGDVVAMNMIQALNSALDVEMAEDPTVVSFGEDAGYFGGVFRVTDKLQQKHGLSRSFDAPISETGIVGSIARFIRLSKAAACLFIALSSSQTRIALRGSLPINMFCATVRSGARFNS